MTLARDLGMQVVAEGIETAEQLAILRGLGCDFGQGYHFSPPLPGHVAETLLTASASAPGCGAILPLPPRSEMSLAS